MRAWRHGKSVCKYTRRASCGGADNVGRWYTSLIGKASSIPSLIAKLGEHQVGTFMREILKANLRSVD